MYSAIKILWFEHLSYKNISKLLIIYDSMNKFQFVIDTQKIIRMCKKDVLFILFYDFSIVLNSEIYGDYKISKRVLNFTLMKCIFPFEI